MPATQPWTGSVSNLWSAEGLFPTRTTSQTTTALVASPNASDFGQPATFTATVTPTPHDIGTPTGSVTFNDGSMPLGTRPLNASGVATFTTTTPLAVGSHVITADYHGDSSFAPSTSSPVNQIVNRGTTLTALSSSANPSVFSQLISLTATVTTVVGTPTGNVIFREGATALGTAALDSSGLAILATSTLSPGMHTVTADYSGDNNFTVSTSGALTQSVDQAPVAIAISTSADATTYGQPVTFTVTVAAMSPATGTPTGTVSFRDGSTTLGSGTLDSGGHALLTTKVLVAGQHAISASFSGDANFLNASSVAITQTVNPAATTATVTSSNNASNFGQPVTFTAVVRAIPPGDGTPTGTVTFRDGATILGTASLDGAGTATVATATLSGGNHLITAVYNGDVDFTPSTSPSFSQTLKSSPNEAFVTALYHVVLKRAPDDSGFNFWVQQLQVGVSRAAVALVFETSAEYRGLEVDRFYDTFLHRTADVVGRAFWVKALVGGRSEAGVVVAFLTSGEYTASHRDSNSYVSGLYQDVLDHPADPAGSAIWQDLLQQGAQSRAQVALSFLSSKEAYLEAIDSYYLDFLGRPADSAGREAYFAALQSGQFTPTRIATMFLASDEFLARAIALADAGSRLS